MLSWTTPQITRPSQELPQASCIRHSGNISRHDESERYRLISHDMNNACTCSVGDEVRVRASKYTIKTVLAKITTAFSSDIIICSVNLIMNIVMKVKQTMNFH